MHVLFIYCFTYPLEDELNNWKKMHGSMDQSLHEKNKSQIAHCVWKHFKLNNSDIS